MNYEHKVQREIADWEHKMFKPPGWLEKTSKTIGNRINHLIPRRCTASLRQPYDRSCAHRCSVRNIRLTVRFSILWNWRMPIKKRKSCLPCTRKLRLPKALERCWRHYVQHGGFSSINCDQNEILFELSHVYGYDTKHFSERVFILKVFQMTFSGQENRARLLHSIKHWHMEKEQWLSDADYAQNMDWETFQIEYRDAMDFRKIADGPWDRRCRRRVGQLHHSRGTA